MNELGTWGATREKVGYFGGRGGKNEISRGPKRNWGVCVCGRKQVEVMQGYIQIGSFQKSHWQSYELENPQTVQGIRPVAQVLSPQGTKRPRQSYTKQAVLERTETKDTTSQRQLPRGDRAVRMVMLKVQDLICPQMHSRPRQIA